MGRGRGHRGAAGPRGRGAVIDDDDKKQSPGCNCTVAAAALHRCHGGRRNILYQGVLRWGQATLAVATRPAQWRPPHSPAVAVSGGRSPTGGGYSRTAVHEQ